MDFDPIIPRGVTEEDYDKYFDAELETMVVEGYADEESLRNIRRKAIILIEAMTRNGIDTLVPYLALSYYDRSVSREGIRLFDRPGMLRLYTLCCVLLASKMRDATFLVQVFVEKWKHVVELPVNLIACEETEILRALDWRLQAPTALTFALYFIRMLPTNLRPWLATVTEVIIQTHSEILLTRYQPSMIAAAATFAVSSLEHPEFTLKIFCTLHGSGRLYREDFKSCIQIIMTSIKNKEFLDWITYPEDEGPRSFKMTTEEEIQKSTGKGIVITEPSEKMKVESESSPENQDVLDNTRVGSLVLKQLGLIHLPETEPDVPEYLKRVWQDLLERAYHHQQESRRQEPKSHQQEPSDGIGLDMTQEREHLKENLKNLKLNWHSADDKKIFKQFISEIENAYTLSQSYAPTTFTTVGPSTKTEPGSSNTTGVEPSSKTELGSSSTIEAGPSRETGPGSTSTESA